NLVRDACTDQCDLRGDWQARAQAAGGRSGEVRFVREPMSIAGRIAQICTNCSDAIVAPEPAAHPSQTAADAHCRSPIRYLVTSSRLGPRSRGAWVPDHVY